MAFPTSPIDNQTYFQNGIYYKYNLANKAWMISVDTIQTSKIINGGTLTLPTGTGSVPLFTDINKTNIGLNNVTNDAQVKKIASSVNGNIAIWNGTTGDTLSDSGKSLPSGSLLGTIDTQTITNKNLTSNTNKFSVISPTADGTNAIQITKADGTSSLYAINTSTGDQTFGNSTTGTASYTFNSTGSNPFLRASRSDGSIIMGIGNGYIGSITSTGYSFVVGNSSKVGIDTNGKMTFVTPTTSNSSINLPVGTTPSSPSNGDLWNDGTNLNMQIAGATIKINDFRPKILLGYFSTISGSQLVPTSSYNNITGASANGNGYSLPLNHKFMVEWGCGFTGMGTNSYAYTTLTGANSAVVSANATTIHWGDSGSTSYEESDAHSMCSLLSTSSTGGQHFYWAIGGSGTYTLSASRCWFKITQLD